MIKVFCMETRDITFDLGSLSLTHNLRVFALDLDLRRWRHDSGDACNLSGTFDSLLLDLCLLASCQ